MIIHLSNSVMIDHALILLTNQNYIPDCVKNKMRSSQSTQNITSYLPFINSIHCIAKFKKSRQRCQASVTTQTVFATYHLLLVRLLIH